MLFRIKWQLTDKPELVPARIGNEFNKNLIHNMLLFSYLANIKSPQHVIRFYEDRLTWANTDENTSINQEKQ